MLPTAGIKPRPSAQQASMLSIAPRQPPPLPHSESKFRSSSASVLFLFLSIAANFEPRCEKKKFRQSKVNKQIENLLKSSSGICLEMGRAQNFRARAESKLWRCGCVEPKPISSRRFEIFGNARLLTSFKVSLRFSSNALA